MIACPTDPEYLKTPFGDTKIPEPIITPTIIATPSINANSFFIFTPEEELPPPREEASVLQLFFLPIILTQPSLPTTCCTLSDNNRDFTYSFPVEPAPRHYIKYIRLLLVLVNLAKTFTSLFTTAATSSFLRKKYLLG